MAEYEYIVVTPEALELLEQEILPRALNGDYEAVKIVLRVLSYAVTQGVPLPEKLSSFLAEALIAIANGGDPKTAFKILRGRGKRDTTNAEKKAQIMALKVKSRILEMRGMSVERVIGQVATEMHASPDAVWKAWKKYKNNMVFSDGSGVVFTN